MSDVNTKLNNFSNAFARLKEGVAKYDGTDDLSRDGLIMRFEFTFELAWKSVKAVFEDEGLTGLNSPKLVLREAFAAGLITDDELWLAMLSDRNSTTHIYSEQKASQTCRHIQEKYVQALGELLTQIEIRLEKDRG